VKAPRELHPFHFLMAWHPRLNTDPRHVWLREAMPIHKSLQKLIPQRCPGKGRLTKTLREAVESGMSRLNKFFNACRCLGPAQLAP